MEALLYAVKVKIKRMQKKYKKILTNGGKSGILKVQKETFVRFLPTDA